MLQELRHRDVLIAGVDVGQLERERPAAATAGVADAVAATTRGAAARQLALAVEQLAADVDLGGRRELGRLGVGVELVGTVDPEPVEDAVDLLLREIAPVGHPLLLELREQLGGCLLYTSDAADERS